MTHQQDGHRGAFVIDDGDTRLATMSYTVAGDDLIIIDHTEVAAALRGTGAGNALLTTAVEWARREHKGIVPLCPFAKSMFDKTPAFSDVRR